MKYLKIFLALLLFLILAQPVLIAQKFRSQPVEPVYPVSARVRDSVASMKVPLLSVPASSRNRQIPAMVDNSRNQYWPGIKDQYQFYTCQQYSGAEYVFGYEMNRMRDKTGWYWENTYPAHYTWNFMNLGERYVGVNFLQSFDVIRQQGHMTNTEYGFDTSRSVLGWVNGYDKYYKGMFNRIKQVYAIEVNHEDGINALRNYLYDHLDGSPAGGIACFTTSSGTLYNMSILPPGTPDAGMEVILQWQSDPVHGMTIVGYNDSIRYDINHDGKFTRNIDITGDGKVDARDWETGGFHIANSYGNWWADTGFVYAMYRSFALNYGEGGVWNNRVYTVEPDTSCRPLLTVKATITYNSRNLIRLLAGVSSDTTAQLPAHIIDFPIFNFQGGEHVMQGYDTIPDGATIELGLDITPLLNFVPTGQAARYFLMVEERDPNQTGQGTLDQVSFIGYHGTTMDVPVIMDGLPIKDNNTTMVSVVANFQKPTVQILTTSLPAFTPPQPMQVQLEATGGTPPYEWSCTENYTSVPSVTDEPLITGTSIQVHHENQSFEPVTLPFSFPFYGKKYDTLYVNYFGFIAFEPQNLPAPYITDENAMLRVFGLIVPSFSQQYVYQFNKNDGIWFQADTSRAIIRWKASVNQYITSSTDDFAVILYPDGRFEFCYGIMDNQDFVHAFYKGVSKGDDLNFDIQKQWNANEMAGKSYLYYPPVVPEGLVLEKSGLLTVGEADSTIIYSLNVRATDAGRISDTKNLMLSAGLGVAHELICGDDARLKSNIPASLMLVISNNTANPMQNLVLKVTCRDTAMIISDSLFTIALLNPGQSLSVPSAFAFRLSDEKPDGFPVFVSLEAHAPGGVWHKELHFPVASSDISVETPLIDDGFNQRLDPGETAELVVTVKNTGSLITQDLRLKVLSESPDVAILSEDEVSVGTVDVFSSRELRFLVRVSRGSLPGSVAPMQAILSDVSGAVNEQNFILPIGTKPVAVVSLSASQSSARAMHKALDSLHVGYDSISELPFEYSRYASIFLILGTANSGNHVLSPEEGAELRSYLLQGGNLFIESYYTWYYHEKTVLHPMFRYTSKKIPAYFYPDVYGVFGTFADSMSFVYAAPMSYAVFDFEPVSPAFATLTNDDKPPKNLEIAYNGDDYKTIGSMLDFGALTGASPKAGQTGLMKQYLDFFELNISGPFPLFHAGSTSACLGQSVTFTDDSYSNIVSRNWEFPGGSPSYSNDSAPVVRYDSAGKFDVQLTVSDGQSTRSIVKQKYIRAGACAGVIENHSPDDLFRIFPNPAGDHAVIELNQGVEGRYSIAVFDLAGRIIPGVTPAIAAGKRILLDLTGVRKGIYFVRLQSGGSVVTRKLVRN